LKLAITGKGGTGKTTVAGLLAYYFKEDGYQVLAVDADPDANFASAIGIPLEKQSSILSISKEHQLIQERTGAKARQFGQLFKMNPVVNDIPDKYLVKHSGIKLLVLGAIQKGGSGCACPENVFLRSLLSEIILSRDEVIIVDMEAGIEHLGRATAQKIDMMIITIEPGVRSLLTAQNIMKLAKDIGISSFGIIGNKIQEEKQKIWLRNQIPHDLILGIISYHRSIQEADFNHRPVLASLDGKLKNEFKGIFQRLLSLSPGKEE